VGDEGEGAGGAGALKKMRLIAFRDPEFSRKKWQFTSFINIEEINNWKRGER
jgi:hypothetical protein